ncbi:MAG: hypothetical protein ABIZ52_05070 [Candidatus Limnocylindrales bacterium]
MSSRLTVLAMSTVAVIALAACTGPTTAPNPTQASTATDAPPAATGVAGATTTPGGGGATAPCSLFTQAELKTATGKDWGVGMDDGYGQCVWHVGTATVNDGKGQIVATFVDQPLSALKSAFPGGADLNVGSLAAYWNPATGVQTFYIDQGAKTLSLSFDPIYQEILADVLKLADVAVSKL